MNVPTYPHWTPVADRCRDVDGLDRWAWRLTPSQREAHDAAVASGLVLTTQRRNPETLRFELLAKSINPTGAVRMRTVAAVRFG